MRRKISLLVISLGLAFIVVAGPGGEFASGHRATRNTLINAIVKTPPGGMPDEAYNESAKAIREAIKGLKSINSFTVRNSLRTIAKLENSPQIYQVVVPIKNVLLNKSYRYDSFVRSLSASTLGQVIKTMDNEGVEAQGLDALILALQTDPVYKVRESAANALGYVGNVDAVPALLYASENDPSPFVKRSAQLALIQLRAISYQGLE